MPGWADRITCRAGRGGRRYGMDTLLVACLCVCGIVGVDSVFWLVVSSEKLICFHLVSVWFPSHSFLLFDCFIVCLLVPRLHMLVSRSFLIVCCSLRVVIEAKNRLLRLVVHPVLISSHSQNLYSHQLISIRFYGWDPRTRQCHTHMLSPSPLLHTITPPALVFLLSETSPPHVPRS